MARKLERLAKAQPSSNSQRRQPLDRVVWVDRNDLRPNAYNPNAVAPRELELLKISILADGWTQPIVARTDGEVVDGFHRWTVSADPEVSSMTGGYVPVVYLDTPMEHQMMSTIRHNRARGVHSVLKMGAIAQTLKNSGVTDKQILKDLGMEREELDRLTDNLTMYETAGAGEYSNSWLPEFSDEGQHVKNKPGRKKHKEIDEDLLLEEDDDGLDYL